MAKMILFLAISGVFGAALANPKDTAKEESAKTAPQKKDGKQTDMSFDELLIQGRYHFTDEGVTTVEQDKVLDGLLQVRKDFKDRIEQSSARY